ncbi:DNA-directed RNA polymerase I subunit RPA1 [Trichonephila clavipes]|nr:DNA-directed RNA polymerase I subunit RPA1 [Trichonephila clavipes]
MDDNITFKTIKGMSFGLLSTEDIKKISVLEITNIELLDCLGNAAPGGLYDLRLGPNDRNEICQTCGLGDMHCAGHSGHISLPVPIYNPVFFSHLYQLLRGSCFSCKKLMAPSFAVHLTLYQLQALDYGLVSTVNDLAEMANEDLNEQSAEENLYALCQKLERKFQKARREAKADEYQAPVKSIVECRNPSRQHPLGKGLTTRVELVYTHFGRNLAPKLNSFEATGDLNMRTILTTRLRAELIHDHQRVK